MGKRRRVRHRFVAPALLGILLVALPLGAQERGGDGGQVANAHVLGVVVDREGGDPLGTVRVVLANAEGEEVWSGVTDVRGRFRITLIPPGTYDVSFSRLAYRTATEQVLVAPEAEVDMRVQLASEAIELEPVVVTSSRRSPLQRMGFYERERTFHGEFFLREDIEDQNALSVPELVRMIPAFQVVGRPPDDLQILSQRGGLGLVPGQPPCRPAVFLDGAPLDFDPWNVVRPDHLAAMEVYPSMMTPAQFYTRGACGAIVMWTIQEDAQPGERGQEGRGHYVFAAVAAAVATFHVFLH